MLTEPTETTVHNNGKIKFPEWTPRQVFSATLVVLAVMIAFWFIYRFRLVVFSVFEAIVFSTALRPIVDWLQKRRLPRALGTTLIFLLIVLLLVGIVLLFIPLFTQQGTNIANTLVQYYQNFRQSLLSSSSILITRLAQQLPASISVAPPGSPPANSLQPLSLVSTFFGYGLDAVYNLFITFTLLLLTFYWTVDRDRVVRSILIFLPQEKRESAREFLEASEVKVGAYLRGLGIMCATIGLLSFAAYFIIGLPYQPLLAVVAGLMESVPLLGPILGAIPAILIALALDPSKVIWVVLSVIIIQQFENHILVPRVMNQSVGVNPVVSLLAFVIFSSLFGIAGALLAIPLAATLQLVFYRTFIETPDLPPTGRSTISLLRYEAQELVQDVRKQVREKDTLLTDPTDEVDDAIEAIVNDLDSILAREEKQMEIKQVKEKA
jgi:predicted PurR-regulated permease PerM